MKQPANIQKDTVGRFADQGFSFYVPVLVSKEADTTLERVYVKVSAIQLSKAVLSANRGDVVIIDAQFGRNGRKSAYVQSIPCFSLNQKKQAQ